MKRVKGVKPRPLRELFAGLGTAVPELEITGLALDSRKVVAGDLFLALHGGAGHGLSHVEQAVERGATAVAWEPAPGVSFPRQVAAPEFAVPQLASQVGEIASRFFGEPSKQVFVFGVTGTDGKTSTAHLVAQALDQLQTPCTYLGTIGYGRLDALDAASHTTPDPVTLQSLLAASVAGGSRAISLEVSSHALDQNRAGGVQFDAVALTNLQRDHLDYHGTPERYAAAKRKLFEPIDARALILNRDDAVGRQWLAEFARLPSHAARLASYGLDGEAASTPRWVIGRDLELHGAGSRLTLDTHAGRVRVSTRLLGRFNAYNLMATAAALLAGGHALDRVADALGQLRTVPGRIEGFHGAGAAPLVVVDYAHTPQALEQILKALRAHTAGRLWCVFGCGGDRDRGKRPLMGAAAAQHADALIVTDDNPRSETPEAIAAEIVAGIGSRPVRVIHDRATAIRTAVAEAQPGDVVVVAGKGHEDHQIVGAERRRFSDRHFVAELVGAESPA